MSELTNTLSTENPDSLQIVRRDMNRCKQKLPNLTQCVSCTTRKEACLDEFLCNVKDAYPSAYRSIKGLPLKNSDHNMVNMQLIYQRTLAKLKPQEKRITCITDESIETLNASFDVTNWDVFVDNAKDVDELVDTISEYIKFNVDMLVPKETVKQYANNKPWISSELRR